jgi:hypothetical protein
MKNPVASKKWAVFWRIFKDLFVDLLGFDGQKVLLSILAPPSSPEQFCTLAFFVFVEQAN